MPAQAHCHVSNTSDPTQRQGAAVMHNANDVMPEHTGNRAPRLHLDKTDCNMQTPWLQGKHQDPKPPAPSHFLVGVASPERICPTLVLLRRDEFSRLGSLTFNACSRYSAHTAALLMASPTTTHVCGPHARVTGLTGIAVYKSACCSKLPKNKHAGTSCREARHETCIVHQHGYIVPRKSNEIYKCPYLSSLYSPCLLQGTLFYVIVGPVAACSAWPAVCV